MTIDSVISDNSQIQQTFQALANSPTLLDSNMPSSPLFAPIDSLTTLLLDTNICPFLPKLYGIYKSVEDINFSTLPRSFVLKTNHDCGGVVIVPDKKVFLKDSNLHSKSMEKLKHHLNTNYYTILREYHYKDIEPRIFAEELLGNNIPMQSPESTMTTKNIISSIQSFKTPDDYKLHCFGEEIFSEVIIDRGKNTRCTFFDMHWHPIPVNITYDSAQRDIPKPQSLEKMFAIARRFYQDIGYLRCDFYVLDTQHFILGEITLTPGSGCLPIRPREYDDILGGFWRTKPFC